MKKLIIILLFFVSAYALYSQNYYNKMALYKERYNVAWKKFRNEITYFAGASNFLGELGGRNQIGTDGIRDFDFESIRWWAGIGYSYKLKKELIWRNIFMGGYLHGDDKYTKEPFRSNRNINFRTPIIEFSSQLQLTLTREREGHRYRLKGIKGWRDINVTSYIYGGVGVFYFNPQGKKDGKWYNLRPLCTEGQTYVPTRKKYSLVQLNIPYGIGWRRNISREWAMGLEYGLRKTYTDYIDDVSTTYYDNNTLLTTKGELAAYFADPSLHRPDGGDTGSGQQRGDLTDKDAYMFLTITLIYKPNNHDFVFWNGSYKRKKSNYSRFFR